MGHAIVVIAGTMLAVLGVYFGARSVLGDADDRTFDLAGKVLLRLAALHGLVLALVFAGEVVEYHQIEADLAAEANAAADLYFDAARYDPALAQQVQPALRRYLELASEAEWAHLGTNRQLMAEGWIAWDGIYNAVLALEPETAAQDSLRGNMLHAVARIAEMRDMRQHHAITGMSALFWIAALGGVFLVSVGFYVFPPERPNLVLISTYAGYLGLILYTILALSNPFAPPGALEPEVLEALRARLAAS